MKRVQNKGAVCKAEGRYETRIRVVIITVAKQQGDTTCVR